MRVLPIFGLVVGLTTAGLLTACGADDSPTDGPKESVTEKPTPKLVTYAPTVWVYDTEPLRQCEQGYTLAESAQKLAANSVMVLESYCGNKTGVMMAMVCGGPSTAVMVHAINEPDLAQANDLGFKPIDELKMPEKGVDVARAQCPSVRAKNPDA